jgi:hypothetical protein
MIDKLINDFDRKMLIESKFLLNELEEYKAAKAKYSSKIEEIKNILTKENSYLISYLDCYIYDIDDIGKMSLYKEGIKDGIKIYKFLKNTGVITSNCTMYQALDRASELQSIFHGELEIRKYYSNLYQYIYLQAYEEGFKNGYKDALE